MPDSDEWESKSLPSSSSFLSLPFRWSVVSKKPEQARRGEGGEEEETKEGREIMREIQTEHSDGALESKRVGNTKLHHLSVGLAMHVEEMGESPVVNRPSQSLLDEAVVSFVG